MTLLAALVAAPVGAVLGGIAAAAGLRWAHAGPMSSPAPPIAWTPPLAACALSAAATFAAFALLAPFPAAACALLALTLVCAGAADLAVRRLPDAASAVVAALAFGLAAARGGWVLAEGAVAGAVILTALVGLKLAFARAGKAALGWGDIKLAAALALWLGAAAPWGMALAGLLGLAHVALARPADGRIPFGPALAAGFWITGLAVEAGWLGALAP
jgi:leader peptidase (prepilin peptidase) / N-methyltransferase